MATRDTLKGYFNSGDKPTEAQFATLIDSFALVAEAGAVGAGAIFGVNITGDPEDQVNLKALLDLKLSLAGGTMTGNLNLGGKLIENVDEIDVGTLNTNDIQPPGVETTTTVGTTAFTSGNVLLAAGKALYADAILEVTEDEGVEIDGVTMKDGDVAGTTVTITGDIVSSAGEMSVSGDITSAVGDLDIGGDGQILGTLACETISEVAASGAGVTVDSLLIKDGGISGAGDITTSAGDLTVGGDGAITGELTAGTFITDSSTELTGGNGVLAPKGIRQASATLGTISGAGPTALTRGLKYFAAVGADTTFTISGAPLEGDTITLHMIVTGSARDVTFPSCQRVGSTDVTPAAPTITFQVGTHAVVFEYVNSIWRLTDSGDD